MSDPKSPRDWLLARHAAAGPRLEAVRRRSLPEPARDVWHELFAPHRRIWQALACAWVLVLVFHYAGREAAPVAGADAPAPAAAAEWLKYLQSRDAFAQNDPRHR